MVQESTTFGLYCVKDDFVSSKVDSSHFTQCSPSMERINVISLQEEDHHDEEELRRRKREELIQYYIPRHEAFLKYPNVCVDAIHLLYDLVPRAKRSQRKSRYKESISERKDKKLKTNPIKISEVSSFESFLKNVQGNVEHVKKSLITTKEKVSEAILPMEKIQEKRIPNIESLLKKEKRKKLVVFHKQKPNRVLSDVVLPVELKNKIQAMGFPISNVSLVIEKTLYSTDLSEKHMRLSIPMKQVLNHKEFLTPQEKVILDTRDSCNRKSQIKFNLIEPSLEESSIHLAKWEMNSSSSYVLYGWHFLWFLLMMLQTKPELV